MTSFKESLDLKFSNLTKNKMVNSNGFILLFLKFFKFFIIPCIRIHGIICTRQRDRLFFFKKSIYPFIKIINGLHFKKLKNHSERHLIRILAFLKVNKTHLNGKDLITI